MTERAPFSTLYPILDDAFETRESLPDAIGALARAGCRLFQLRGKACSTRELMRLAETGVAAATRHGISMLVNDRADIALLTGAHGVHLGQDDLSVASARRILGPDAIIGLSSHSIDQAAAAATEEVDYVAIGPAFATTTKAVSRPPLGVDTIREVCQAVDKPVVAIGGVDRARARELIEVGVAGVAAISALRAASSDTQALERTAREWLDSMEGAVRR